MLSPNEQWSARRPANLPTYRQIQYWASHGALGERLRPRGSGFHIEYTTDDYVRLAAIKRLVDDLAALKLGNTSRTGRAGLSVDIVADLWQQLEATGRAVLERGSVRIDLALDDRDAS